MTRNDTGAVLNREKSGAGLADAAQIRYLSPADAAFTRTEGHMLNVNIGGQVHSGVYIQCSFPHTNKRIYLSVRTAENEEIGMIRSLDEFPDETQKLLEEQIQLRYFAPEITKVLSVKEEFGYSYWETETTSGLCRFTVRGGGGNIKLMTPNRLLVVDVDGNRFIVPELDRLSDKEYRMIEVCM
ncbi:MULTISPECIES: DUF1854 domain-containing protein [Paenibacillus]|uniref:DUF1854 domain-containing protein n=1 Tax=Paenibacillus albilobatus TaxID=2716884 RepID=A0A919XKX9_9BACL|nr:MULTISPECIES: DUF1854 domain-containing protein [Paenibacillus]GIO32602.1 hypothetical protein J2TS6_37430 [Paenibacillus albilobatus]